MTEEDLVSFIPDVGENRDLFDDEQVWCEMVPMTAEEIRAYQKGMATVKPNSRESYERAGKIVARILKDRVFKIHNYSDIRNSPITDGDELYIRGEPNMIDAVYEGLTEISTLKSGLKKN